MRLFEHLGEAREFARTVRQRRVVAQELRRMIADLFQLRERGQHDALALHAFGATRCASIELLDHGGVERGLLLGERAEDLHLLLLGQVGDDRLVRLQAAKDERAGDLLEARAPPPDRACPESA